MTSQGIKSQLSVEDYLIKSQKECSDRFTEPSFFAQNDLQNNALRVESLRDITPRCGKKMPEHWPESVKKRGWGIWIFSGGTAEVFGFCSLKDCPKREFFLRSSPYKHIRKEAEACKN